jgi:hypothetical protein
MESNSQSQRGTYLHVPPKEIKRLRVGNRHAFYSLKTHAEDLALIACVAQDTVKPCTWAVSYTAEPDNSAVVVRRISFDANDLRKFREAYANRSLSWLDSAFMLRLSLDRVVRMLVKRNVVAVQEPRFLTLSDLHLLRVNGALPQLDSLLSACQEHVLLYRDLREVKDLPPLTES